MEQILITGGAGLIGWHLADRLINEGNHVIIMDDLSSGDNVHDGCEFVFGDIVRDRIPKADKIYNLACPASPKNYQKNPIQTLDTCYIGTKRILDIGVPVLHASTSEVYGDPEQHPQAEEYNGNVSIQGPRSCYDEGKRVAETMCYHYPNATVVRIFNTYGPHMKPNDGRVIPNFIYQALNNKRITVYGDGEQTRSLCYVADTVDGLIKAMEVGHDQPINIGNPEEITIQYLAETIVKLTNSKSEIVYSKLPDNDPKRRKPDITKAKRILDWEPQTSLIEGLTKTIELWPISYTS